MINLNKMAKKAKKTAIKRQRNGANINVETVAMLKHCATEVIEASQEYFYFLRSYKSKVAKHVFTMFRLLFHQIQTDLQNNCR